MTYQTKNEAITAANLLRAEGKTVKVMQSVRTLPPAINFSRKSALPTVNTVKTFFLVIS